MNNIEKLQNIFQELRKDDEEGHGSAYELQWEDIETIENLIQENKELKEKNKYLPAWVGRKYVSKDKIKEIIYGNYEDLEIILKIKELLKGE
jgi:NDP-sugar pyrophosphorylase family protein